MIERGITEFKSFFLGNFNTVVRFVLTFTADGDEAEDIAQETFLRLYERWDNLATPEETRSFMYTTAHNLSISRLRHQNVAAQYGQHLLEEGADREDPRVAEEITYQETLREHGEDAQERSLCQTAFPARRAHGGRTDVHPAPARRPVHPGLSLHMSARGCPYARLRAQICPLASGNIRAHGDVHAGKNAQ